MGEARLITDRLRQIAENDPERHCVSDGPYGRFTYGQIAEQVDRIAVGLAHQGIGKGDVVIVQLPNWVPFVVFHIALTRIGAITATIPIAYRENELNKAIGLTDAKALIVPKIFAKHNFEKMAKSVAQCADSPLTVVYVDGPEESSITHLLTYENMLKQSWESRSSEILCPPISLDDTTAIGFTSGTTGALKATIYDTRILHETNLGLLERYGLNEEDRILGFSPLGHAVGFTHILRMGFTIGGSLSLLDRWNPEEAMEIAKAEGTTFVTGATPFLLDFVYHPALRNYDSLGSIRLFLCGGATIPQKLMEDAQDALPNTYTSPLWGMTECGGVTTCPFDAPPEKLLTTDGLPCDRMELKIVDPDGQSLPPNEEGELYVRGPMLTKGYYAQLDLTRESYLKDGFFRTGDLARMDEDGYIKITGRIKDLIIRGGVNISTTEIEEVLFSHPDISNVAVVGMPDPRLGERVCAFLTLSGDHAPELKEIQDWMNKHKVSKQKWPERVEIIDELPMTASKKIQKFKLRELVTDSSEAGSLALEAGND
jgi:cyclohexanecarboxylate-CoA ligase